MSKKILLTIIVIIVAALLVGGVWLFLHRVQSNEFVGKVTKADGNTLTMEGVFVVKDRPDLSNPSNSKTVSVVIDQNTKLTKEKLFLPTAQEVEKTGGRFNPSDLKREAIIGSIDDFKTGQVSVRVLGMGNIYGKKLFVASEVIYIEPVYP